MKLASGQIGRSAADKKEAEEQEAEWQAERDLNTLIDAEKIKQDKDRIARVLKRKKTLMAALKNAGEE